MASIVETLVANLERGAALLDRHGVNPHWASLLRGYAARLEKGDRGAAADLLKQFGGMGSFNDGVISPLNGHRVEEDQIDVVNNQLNDLRERLYAGAHDLAS